MREIKGKTALVTGSARRIGKEIALALGEEGVNVIIHYNRSEKEAKKVCEELKKLGVEAFLLKADFEKEREREEFIERAFRISGGFSVLINNASIYEPRKKEDFKDFVKNLEINSWSPYFFSLKFAELAEEGDIINILDTRSDTLNSKFFSYSMSKHLLAIITQRLALELAPRIRVNGIAPGIILPSGKEIPGLKSLIEKVPLRRKGSVEDITSAVLFLLKNDYITGEIIYVDGGLSITRKKI